MNAPLSAIRWDRPPGGFQSWAEWLSVQDAGSQREFVAQFGRHGSALQYFWPFWARQKQIAPPGDWSTWVFLGGRGVGKTKSGSQWVIDLAWRGVPQKQGIALVGATAGDAQKVIIHGPSGILACSPPWFMPTWNGSLLRLEWPNGEWALVYSADRPDRFRGANHNKAWFDELASWRFPDAYEQAMLTMRVGDNPQVCITTTPRPTQLIRELVKQSKEPRADTIVVKATTYENRANLSPKFFASTVRRLEGSRLGRQELNAEILDDNPGALWRRDQIDQDRAKSLIAQMKEREISPQELSDILGLTKVVVAIDPAVTSNPDSNETGIVVVGAAGREHGYLLDDGSGIYKPDAWATKALELYEKWHADEIVAETNNGGDLIEHALRTQRGPGRKSFRFVKVNASRGKRTRAEPVSILSEQHRIHHVGEFGELEDQLCDWDPAVSVISPDRLDAYVWGFTHLLVGDPPPPRGNVDKSIAIAIG